MGVSGIPLSLRSSTFLSAISSDITWRKTNDNSVFARSAMDPETPQTPEDYRALLRRVTRPGSFVFLQVMSEEMADKKVELRRDKGIPLTRVTAARLAMEFEAEYDFVFLRPGVFCFNDLFAAVADEVGWHEPTRIG